MVKIKKKTEKEVEGKVCEIYELEKNGKEKVVKTCGCENLKHADKEELEKQNKTLKGFFIFMIIIVGIILVWYGIGFYNSHFEYEGMKFDIIKSQDVMFYHTIFPIYENMKKIDYNVYLRNDPRKSDVSIFEEGGSVRLREMMVFEGDEELNCEGDGGIAVYNMQQIFRAMGTQMIKDPNATCDYEGTEYQGRYMHVQIIQGDENKIEEKGWACYKLYVKDCDILPVTEKFILEAVKKFV